LGVVAVGWWRPRYFFNFSTGASVWERPDLEHHRKRCAVERLKLQQKVSVCG
jgi:hypothetical protein